LNIQILQQNVDVNIHPSKEEVNFLNEEKICTLVSIAVARTMNECSRKSHCRSVKNSNHNNGNRNNNCDNHTNNEDHSNDGDHRGDDNTREQGVYRNSSIDTVNTNNKLSRNASSDSAQNGNILSFLSASSRLEGCHQTVSKLKSLENSHRNSYFSSGMGTVVHNSLIDVDSAFQRNSIDKEQFAKESSISPSISLGHYNRGVNISEVKQQQQQQQLKKKKEYSQGILLKKRRQFTEQSSVQLTSIHNLLSAIAQRCDDELAEVIVSGQFIGMADRNTSLILHETSLYLINNYSLTKEFFYQSVILHFSSFKSFSLSPAPSLLDLLMISMDSSECGWQPEDGSKDIIAQAIVDLLVSKGPMLLEYFGIEFSIDGLLLRLPFLIPEYIPPLYRLPLFLFFLATRVNWNQEQECFHTVAVELSKLYALETPDDFAIGYKEQQSRPNSESIIHVSNSVISNDDHFQRYPIIFKREHSTDHPLQRALEFCSKHTDCYLFAKEYSKEFTQNSSGARFYIAQDLDSFFADYIKMNPNERIYDDVLREGYPVKFFADLEFDPLKFVENQAKLKEVSSMVQILKHYIERQWLKDRAEFSYQTSSNDINEYWMEFDASSNARTSRHLYNDAMIFLDSEHLHMFAKRVIKNIESDIEKHDLEAEKLIVFREKNGQKKKEIFIDMLVFRKNHCMRMPWSTKANEKRPFNLVIPSRSLEESLGTLKRERQETMLEIRVVPEFEIFQRCLLTVPFPKIDPLSYPSTMLEERSSQSPSRKPPIEEKTLSPYRKYEKLQRHRFQHILEENIFPMLRTEFIVPNTFLKEAVIWKLFDFNEVNFHKSCVRGFPKER